VSKGNEDIEQLSEQHGGYWGAHPDYLPEDWQYEVANRVTRCGYWEWVEARVQNAKDADDINKMEPATEPAPGITLFQAMMVLDCTKCAKRSEMLAGEMNIWGFAPCPHCGESIKLVRKQS
jgi:hypothetical protein